MCFTPIIKCQIELNGINLYIKRDDLLPFSFGGNKARIAQEFFADMDDKNKNCMIGYGNARSNLSRALANMNSVRGGECHIISPADDDGSRYITNNSFMVHACGAEFHECSKKKVAETVEQVMQQCEKNGFRPYYIYGDKYGKGNEAVPVRAYAKVYQEILEQEKRLGIQFAYIFLSTGTGMTQSGLLAGKACANREKQKIIGISIARKKEQEVKIIENYLDAYFKENPEYQFINNPEVFVDDDYLCGGYGQYTDEIKEVIHFMFVKNGVPLDSTYTGKGFYGMIEYLRKNDINNANVLFLHTGGSPLFFDNIQLLQ